MPVYGASTADYLLRVEVLYRKGDFRGVEPAHVFRQPFLAAQPKEELAARAVVEHEIKLGGGLRMSDDGGVGVVSE